MSRTPVTLRNLFSSLLVACSMLATLTLVGPIARAHAATSVPTLPDERGYEKVSPNENGDGNVYQDWGQAIDPTLGGWTELPYEVASDGSAVAYIGMPSEVGGGGREGGKFGEQYVAHRGGDGRWEAVNVTPPSDELSTVPAYQGFSTDLSRGFLTTDAGTPLVPGAPADHYRVPYTRNFETGAYESLLSALPPNREQEDFGAFGIHTGSNRLEPVFGGVSADYGHILYMVNDALTANAVDEGAGDNNLYDFHNDQLTLVNVLPDGSPEPNAVFGAPVSSAENARTNGPDFSHVISEDGNRIFWTGRGANPNIYMREGATRTVQVDAAVGGGGQYWTATPDGSKVLFTKSGDLYEYDTVDGHTTDLTPDGEVQGLVGNSEDLSYVYVVADAVLAPGGKQGTCTESEFEEGEHGKASNECGLYVLHAGEPARFIAMLSGKDNYTETAYPADDGDWQGGFGKKEAEVTPNGRDILFSSILPLTGYDNRLTEGHRSEEFFVYEFEGAKLRCISCNPSGEPPVSAALQTYLPVSHQDTYSPHWMSDDGSRVFFESGEALVAQDTNGLYDMYEWERDGSGSCTSSEGCLYLLTGGTGGEGAYLIGASATGDDVFFTTRAQLIAEDQNENIDVYDARVDAIVPPVAPECTGTGCQGVPSAPPIFSTPSSVTYNGVGNFAPTPKVVPKSKKAKAKKGAGKKRKKHKPKRTKISKKAKKSADPRPGKGHGSSERELAVSNGRSK